ncbi:CHC2 zinc finger domain-containing protein [Hydrogenophaga sp.]|uniref:CHC2 zinc finger domain-containing protein n=1 Tax=Hydrogenophaga sp. TaxID=1904254 RepID=UPI002CAE99A9|nr:CHC2 zinc finger domain-containing protein [Hydrogenophaga sp.]HMP11178.1 CHC2 zinc finger domain-containing protein [Hydrogenophaga sp.]
MSFDRERLPDPLDYYSTALKIVGRGPWRTSECVFHGGSDSMRVNVKTGGWVCMSCGAKGGDVLSYHMQAHGLEFIDAAKALGAWSDDGRPPPRQKPTPLPPRAALEVLNFEAVLVVTAAGNLAQGRVLTDQDRQRLIQAAQRIGTIAEGFA